MAAYAVVNTSEEGIGDTVTHYSKQAQPFLWRRRWHTCGVGASKTAMCWRRLPLASGKLVFDGQTRYGTVGALEDVRSVVCACVGLNFAMMKLHHHQAMSAIANSKNHRNVDRQKNQPIVVGQLSNCARSWFVKVAESGCKRVNTCSPSRRRTVFMLDTSTIAAINCKNHLLPVRACITTQEVGG